MVTTRGMHKKAPEALKATTTARSAKRVKKAPQSHKNKLSEPQVKTNVGVNLYHESHDDVTVNSLPTPSSSFLKSFDNDYPSNMEEKGQKCDWEERPHECSAQDTPADAGGASSSRRWLDTSSLQPRAEALEALLELCAKLFQDGKYQELEVVLKPFGPGHVCPRETAIWLTKIIKENTNVK
ncbi:hypothetical protein ACLB2K_064807 [Fragaria x ananassa]